MRECLEVVSSRERQLREKLREVPRDAEALRELAKLVGGSRGRKVEAVELWGRYSEVASGPELGQALLSLARAQVEARQEEKAIATLRRCIAEAPSDFNAHDLLGELCRRTGNFDEAAAVLARATQLDPTALRPRAALASCLDAMGRTAEADAALDELRQLGRGSAAVLALVKELIQRRE